MTLDEAIQHAQETADARTDLCAECRAEHQQLADWLRELKDLRAKYQKLQFAMIKATLRESLKE